MKLAICIVSPPGYPHSGAFREVGESLEAAARELGHDVVLTTRTDLADRRSIVLGANLLSHYPHRLRPGTILYNLEQVEAGPWFELGTRDLLRRYRVWDYSARNATELERLGLPRPKVVPIGWSPVLRRIERGPEDVDVLFYGCVNDRRQAIIDALRQSGLKVEVLFGVFGAERDRAIARARIVLNVHHFEARVFEIVRVSYLLANGRVVVSERGAARDEEAPFEAGVAFADYDELPRRCLQLLAQPAERERLAQVGPQLMEARPVTRFLAAALADEVIDLRAAPSAKCGPAGGTNPSGAETSPPPPQPPAPPAAAAAAAAAGAGAGTVAASAPPQGPLAAELKPAGYYDFPRPEVVARIEAKGQAILEVGCAAGAMGAALLSKGAREVVGLEIVREAVAVARRRLTAAYRFDVNALPELPYPDAYFDVLTFSDVLEHLPEPEAVVRHLRRWLRPGGQVVCSVPNVRHESVLTPLLVHGRFTYAAAGILDRTHLRFFTLDSVQRMFTGLGLRLTGDVQAVTSTPTAELAELASLVGRLGGDATRFRQEAVAIQFVVVANAPEGDQQPLPRPIADPWRGSRPTRLLLAPDLSDPTDCWEAVLQTLAQQAAGRPDITVAVALPLALLEQPPQAARDAANRGTIDLLLTEAPTHSAGWQRLFAGGTALLASAPAAERRRLAESVGIEVVDARGLLPQPRP